MKPPKFKTSWTVTHIVSTVNADGVTRHHLVSRGRMIGRSKYDPNEENKKRNADLTRLAEMLAGESA